MSHATDDTVQAYLATWNETDDAARRRLIETHWADDPAYCDPMADVRGRDALGELIGAVHAQFPGFVFRPLGEADAHHGQVRFRWGLGPDAGEDVVEGFDVITVDEQGRVADVRGFLDKVPAGAAQ